MTLGVTPFTPGKLVDGTQDTAMIGPIGADRGAQILQILLGERNPGLLQRPAQPVGQFRGGGVVQVDLSAGGAEHPAQGIVDQLAVGVQLLLILDLGADQNFRLSADLLYGDLAGQLAFERRADLLHGRLLGEAQRHLRAPLEVDPVAHTLHADTDQSRCRQHER